MFRQLIVWNLKKYLLIIVSGPSSVFFNSSSVSTAALIRPSSRPISDFSVSVSAAKELKKFSQ